MIPLTEEGGRFEQKVITKENVEILVRVDEFMEYLVTISVSNRGKKPITVEPHKSILRDKHKSILELKKVGFYEDPNKQAELLEPGKSITIGQNKRREILFRYKMKKNSLSDKLYFNLKGIKGIEPVNMVFELK